MTWWKVKNEMPSGSAISSRGAWRPGIRFARSAKKLKYLKTREDEEIAGERERDQDRGPRLAERLRDQPVDQDRGCEQRHEAPVPVAVEEEGQEREGGKPPLRPEALDRPVQQERRGQENEEEGEGVEEHGEGRAAGAGARSCG